MNRRTDRPSTLAGYRVSCTRLCRLLTDVFMMCSSCACVSILGVARSEIQRDTALMVIVPYQINLKKNWFQAQAFNIQYTRTFRGLKTSLQNENEYCCKEIKKKRKK